MTEHDWLLNQLLNVASWPALREENGDKVRRERAGQMESKAPLIHGS